jgi:hypothetical protein
VLSWNDLRTRWGQRLMSHGRSVIIGAALLVVVLAALAVVSEPARALLEFVIRYGSIGLVVYLAFDLVLRFSHAPSAFDGAGEEFHGPSARAAVILIVAVVAAIALNWVGAGWALNQAYGSGSPLPSGLAIPDTVR